VGNYLLWDFESNRSNPNYVPIVFHGRSYAYILSRNVLGYMLGDSGEPLWLSGKVVKMRK
jgi:hypothetical protein